MYRTDVIEALFNLKNIKNTKQVILDQTNPNMPIVKNIKILLLCLLCNGFGDVAFSLKLCNYIKEWYQADVHIATTKPEHFKTLGHDKNVYGLGYKKRPQCRRLKTLTIPPELKDITYDLLFVAPLVADSEIIPGDIKSMFPYSDQWNTYFFSEYNDNLKKGFDFNTGVGDGRDGLFFTSLDKVPERDTRLPNPYAMVYLNDQCYNPVNCILSFMTMICKKYRKIYPKLDVIAPSWLLEDLYMVINDKEAFDTLQTYYPNINLIIKNEEPYQLTKGKGNILTIRGDILPVSNIAMAGLIINSIDDLVTTGDQSFTEVLSYCPNKNVWYQICGWKVNFSKNLAELLPQPYFWSVKTSCGDIEGINFKAKFSKFVHDWDFRVLGKIKLDKVMRFISNRAEIQDVLEILDRTRSLKSMKHKLEYLIEN